MAKKILSKKDKITWIIIIIVLSVIYFVTEKIIIISNIPSESMENTLNPGDKLIGLRLDREYKRGDILIFESSYHKTLYIKRLIGLPGEKITITNGVITITSNDQDIVLQEDYVTKWEKNNNGYEFIVPEGEYFLLGDNRDESYDARFWDYPFVKKSKIIAKAKYRFWPLKNIGDIYQYVQP